MTHWEYITVTLYKSMFGMGKRWEVDEVDGDIPQDWRNKHGGDYTSLGNFCNLMDEAGWELVTASQIRGDIITLFFRRPTR
jgi:hypothetical protein